MCPPKFFEAIRADRRVDLDEHTHSALPGKPQHHKPQRSIAFSCSVVSDLCWSLPLWSGSPCIGTRSEVRSGSALRDQHKLQYDFLPGFVVDIVGTAMLAYCFEYLCLCTCSQSAVVSFQFVLLLHILHRILRRRQRLDCIVVRKNTPLSSKGCWDRLQLASTSARAKKSIIAAWLHLSLDNPRRHIDLPQLTNPRPRLLNIHLLITDLE